MPVDPNTGMWTNAVQYQPSGAMGAVIELLNSQKANDIAQTLQQQREAQAQMEQQRAQEYAAAEQRAEQQRAAQAALGPEASWEQRVQAGIPYMDPKDWMPFASRTTATDISGQHKENVAGITGENKLAVEGLKGGVPTQMPSGDTVVSPKATSQIERYGSETELNKAKAKRIADMTPAEQQLLMSKSVLARAEASYYAIRQKVAATDPKDPQFAALVRMKIAKDSEINRLLSSNAYAIFQDPDAKDRLTALLAEKSELDRQLAEKMSQAKPSTTSGGGSTTTTPPAAGTSSTPPGTVSKTIVLPPL